MEIEVPEIKDFERINEIAKQVHELHVSWRPDIFISVDTVIPKENFENMVENNNIYVVKYKGNIVGYITFQYEEKISHGMHDRRILKITAIAIDEPYRGKGFGRALLEFTKTYAKKENCTDIYLSVNEENIGARKLYEKIGMTVKNINYSMKVK